MTSSLFDGLITSKMRIRILMRLFLNPDQRSYIRELADEMEVSPSHVSEELKKLSATGLLHTEKKGRQIQYGANRDHPLYPELHSMVRKALGMDRILESVLARLGRLELAILLDDYALGRDTGIIDLLLVGDINVDNLTDLVRKTEKYMDRKIRTMVMSRNEYKKYDDIIRKKPNFVLWSAK